jgi:DNA-binding XRE family transcriptional regulator
VTEKSVTELGIHFNGISKTKGMSNNISKSNIAKNIKKLRQEKGIPQDRLPKLANLSLNTIVNVEAGNNPNPTIETIEKSLKHLKFQLMSC